MAKNHHHLVHLLFFLAAVATVHAPSRRLLRGVLLRKQRRLRVPRRRPVPALV
uniref:Uncharacterized protein n=1 Tax=Setaria viridis TaxID=4556 RepID=A0A4U6TAW5_SETVI|nr:hypothetical protein SEVIR_9G499750v2 [Setaria viridis]